MKKQCILHCHDKILFEELTEPIENRIKYIKENKLSNEIPTRLSVMRLLTDEEVKTIPWEAWKAWDKAWEAQEAREKVQEAQEAYEEAQSTPKMMEWHKKVCLPDCPWNGRELVFKK